MDGLEFPLPANFFSAGSKMYDGTLVALLNMLNSRIYTDANRPDPATLQNGTMIWNDSAGTPQWARNGVWVDAMGNPT